MTPSIIALIPARAGSKRVPSKNIRLLNGHPLLAYAIATALEADIFNAIAVSSDDPETIEIARSYGATNLILRPSEMALDHSPDIDWVRHAVESLRLDTDAFCILRPTSPFRRGDWVKRAWDYFRDAGGHSLRAMRPVSEHPGKMWRIVGDTALPLLPFAGTLAPWHSSPTQELPRLYVQTAALEIAWTEVLYRREPSISGSIVVPWVGGADEDGCEGIDINSEVDWDAAVVCADSYPYWLPPVKERVRV